MPDLPWYLQENDIENVWRLTKRGKGASLIMFDTCVDTKHQGLYPRVTNENKCQAPGSSDNFEDNHGTAVASIITAKEGTYACKTARCDYHGKKFVKVAGVIPESRILALSDVSFINKAEDKAGINAKLKHLLSTTCKLSSTTCEKYEIATNLESVVWTQSKSMSSIEAQKFLGQVCREDSNIVVTLALGNKHFQVKSDGLILFENFTPRSKCDNTLIRVAGLEFYKEDSIITPYMDGTCSIDYSIDAPTIYAPAKSMNVLALDSHEGASIEQGTSLATPLVGATIQLMMLCNPVIKKDEAITKLKSLSNHIDGLDVLNIGKVVNSMCLGKETSAFDEF